MIEVCFSSSASAAARSWCEIEALTKEFEEVEET